jgi:hypothetical protein
MTLCSSDTRLKELSFCGRKRGTPASVGLRRQGSGSLRSSDLRRLTRSGGQRAHPIGRPLDRKVGWHASWMNRRRDGPQRSSRMHRVTSERRPPDRRLPVGLAETKRRAGRAPVAPKQQIDAMSLAPNGSRLEWRSERGNIDRVEASQPSSLRLVRQSDEARRVRACRSTFDMRGGLQLAKRAVRRALDGGVRPHCSAKLNGCFSQSLVG